MGGSQNHSDAQAAVHQALSLASPVGLAAAAELVTAVADILLFPFTAVVGPGTLSSMSSGGSNSGRRDGLSEGEMSFSGGGGGGEMDEMSRALLGVQSRYLQLLTEVSRSP